MSKEIWKDIKGFKSYQISIFGRVKSFKRGTPKILKEGIGSGYSHVSLCNLGIVSVYKVHRLVAIAFIPNPKNKPQVNHIDGDKMNNHLINLEWTTRSENILHGVATGLIPPTCGLINGNVKLTEPKVRRIRKSNLTGKELAKKYNVSRATISLIINRKLWQHI